MKNEFFSYLVVFEEVIKIPFLLIMISGVLAATYLGYRVLNSERDKK